MTLNFVDLIKYMYDIIEVDLVNLDKFIPQNNFIVLEMLGDYD